MMPSASPGTAPHTLSDEQAPIVPNAALRFSPRPWAVAPGELFHLDLTVAWWMEAPMEQVALELLLPEGISTPAGATGAVRQPLPALGYGESFTATIALVSSPDTATTQRVVTLRLGLVCPNCQEIWIE
ncbi:MAG: hypothetical protein KAX65_11340, partial [Caldilineaceae bacterium]|nr:hypothetical protein [Caldilineaceae bacterium]